MRYLSTLSCFERRPALRWNTDALFMSDNDQGSGFRTVWNTSSDKLCVYPQNTHLHTRDDSSVSWWLNWMSCLPLQLGMYVRCDVSFGSCFFFCFDALQGCHMCNLKHYNLSSNLSTRQLWCMSWITGNISSVWSRFILRKCHFKEPPCRISAAGDVEKEGEETLKTSALPTPSHSHRALFKGMPKTPCGFR